MNASSSKNFVVDTQATVVYIPRIRKEHSCDDIDVLLHCHRIGELVSVRFNEIAPNSVFAPSANTIAEFNSAIVVFKFYTGVDCAKSVAAKEGFAKDGFYNWYVKNSSRHSEECWLLLPYKSTPLNPLVKEFVPMANKSTPLNPLAKEFVPMANKSTPLNPLAKEFVPASKANTTVNHSKRRFKDFEDLITWDERQENLYSCFHDNYVSTKNTSATFKKRNEAIAKMTLTWD
jgi:hypothetical protein